MRLSPGVVWTCLVVFLANAALLVLQLVANRLLAPFIGSSLETWTSVIGVILAGISLGNAAGGRLADRAASPRTLRIVLALGSAATLFTLAVVIALDGSVALAALPLKARIALLTALTCFPPAFVLSLLTPLSIRLTLPDVRRTGRVVGVVYALGTLGSLVGNFLTGFVLIAHLSTYTITGGIAVLLLALALATPAAPPLAAAAEDGAPVDEVAAGPASLSLRAACAIVFVSSFASMALEMVASRLLAPYLGGSLYSWTGLIGVVLAGMAIGNWAGGWIADRFSRRDVLGFSLFLASLATIYALFMFDTLANAAWLRERALVERTLIWSVLLFLPVMTALGTISPQVTRLAVFDVAHAGSVAGKIYAWSCAGAIAGTFATGWWLIQLAGVLKVTFGAALLLALIAVPAGAFRERPADFAACTLLFLGGWGALWSTGKLKSRFVLETNYFSIHLSWKPLPDGYHLRFLVLDKLIHSMVRGKDVDVGGQKVFQADPAYLGYWHERSQAELAVLASLAPDPQVLVIGGGGYTMPRWIDRFLKEVRCDVVEIDPGVTEVAHALLGLPRDSRFTAHHMDGRQFVQEHAKPGQYRLVMQDAVNDLAVPFHLMTREYNDAIRRILAPDGVYLLTVIDDWEEGRLYRAAITTLRKTFAHVHVVGAGDIWAKEKRSVMVLYASAKPLDLEENRRKLAERGIPKMLTMMVPPPALDRLIDAKPHVVLTDTYAPVDNLISVQTGADRTSADPAAGR